VGVVKKIVGKSIKIYTTNKFIKKIFNNFLAVLHGGKKVFGESIEMYNTNKIMKKYLKVFQKCGSGSFGRFNGVTVGVAIFCLFVRTDGQMDLARSTRLLILINNIYTLYCWKPFLLPVTYFLRNLVYPFTLRVTVEPKIRGPFFEMRVSVVFLLFNMVLIYIYSKLRFFEKKNTQKNMTHFTQLWLY